MRKIIVTKQISVPIAHRLLNYNGLCKNIHGHNLKIEFSFSIHGSSYWLDESGFIVDLSKIKKELGKDVKDMFDHSFVVNPFDTNTVAFLETEGFKHYIMPKKTGRTDAHSVGLSNPTIENIGMCLYKSAKVFAKTHSVDVESVRIFESDTGWVTVGTD